MKKILKQVTGIDVAKDELVVCLGNLYEDLSIELYAHKVFPNSLKGFESLVKLGKKIRSARTFCNGSDGGLS